MVSMSEVKTKRPFLSHRAKVILALAVISIFVVLAFFLPSEGDSNNITGDSATTPTFTITHLVATLTVSRSVELSSVHFTVTQVQEAAAFSNDRKHGGTYTVRVYIQALNRGEKIELRGFGSFRVRQRDARRGRNPKTGAPVDIPAKRVPYFKPGKELKELINAQSDGDGFDADLFDDDDDADDAENMTAEAGAEN